ncbi:hypothetical protein MRX96_047190 [Rhipicephalus microplus]
MKVFTAASIYSFTILVFSASDVDITSAALFIVLVVVCAFDELTMERPALAVMECVALPRIAEASFGARQLPLMSPRVLVHDVVSPFITVFGAELLQYGLPFGFRILPSQAGATPSLLIYCAPARRAAIADDEERFGFANILHNVKPWSVSTM